MKLKLLLLRIFLGIACLCIVVGCALVGLGLYSLLIVGDWTIGLIDLIGGACIIFSNYMTFQSVRKLINVLKE